MAKGNFSEEIAKNYADYQDHMNCDKTFVGPLEVPAPEHPGAVTTPHNRNFYEGNSSVSASLPCGNTTVECRVKKVDEYYYTLLYLTDTIKTRVLARLDAGAGAHRNPAVPLAESSVPCPHYHEYTSDGHLIAFRIPGVVYSEESSTQFDISKGFSYFCTKLHLTDVTKTFPSLKFAPPGILPLEIINTDPTLGVVFP